MADSAFLLGEQYPSPHSSSDYSSPSGSQCSSIDPRLLLLDTSGEDNEDLSQQSIFVHASSPPQYMAEPSPVPEELSYDDFLAESAPYPTESWDEFGGASSFFDEILFRGSE